jgi:CRISPR-associated endonuclease/helicase Cas3
VVNIFAEKFNTYILLMTATQPDILSGNELVNLIDERKYAEDPVFDRVNLKLLNELNPFSINDFIDYFYSKFNSDNCLIVCNTINSALNIYDKLKDKSNDYKVYSLTTNLIPIDRKDRINNIDEELKAGEKVIVISTQLIEAGVDLSFKEVYRDFGPLDSIVQVAGRCNRNSEYENKGKVNIIKLKDEKDREFSKRIYDNKLLDICEEVLSENTSFLEMSKSYFAKVNDSFTRDNKYLMNAIQNLNYSKKRDKEIPIKDFTIIEERAGKEDIIICIDEGVELKVRNLIELYEEIKETKDNKKLNRLIAQKELINKELANYRVSVYRNQLEKYYSDYQIVNEFKYLKYVDYEDQKEYLYDENIGFLRDPKKPPASSLVF